jgi:hypothetical protein
MAAGGQLLDADGKVRLQSNGKAHLSDGAGDDCCCNDLPTAAGYYPYKACCHVNAERDEYNTIWWDNADGTNPPPGWVIRKNAYLSMAETCCFHLDSTTPFEWPEGDEVIETADETYALCSACEPDCSTEICDCCNGDARADTRWRYVYSGVTVCPGCYPVPAGPYVGNYWKVTAATIPQNTAFSGAGCPSDDPVVSITIDYFSDSNCTNQIGTVGTGGFMNSTNIDGPGGRDMFALSVTAEPPCTGGQVSYNNGYTISDCGVSTHAYGGQVTYLPCCDGDSAGQWYEDEGI